MATILVVDDHVINRTFLVTLLGYGNHHVLEAGDGVEALQSMAQQRPDLVISDVLMPHMDGHEFVARMRATPSLAMVPTIFYTAGHHEAEARAIASSCGVTRVLPKPSEPDAILRAVSEMLGLHHVAPALPTLTVPPAEGSRFNTIGNQLAEYLVELESSSTLIAQMVGQSARAEILTPERDAAARRLARSLENLQAASGRLTALVEISREIAAEHINADADAERDTDADTDAPAAASWQQLALTSPIEHGAAALVSDAVSPERARFQARLNKAMRFGGYDASPTLLAREFNSRFEGRSITIHAARKWLLGESIPTQDKLRVLANWLGVTAEWLRFGDAGLHTSGRATQPSSTSEEGLLLAELLQLDPYHRRLAYDFVSMLAAKHLASASGAAPRPTTRRRSEQLKPD
jgi:CheY-like chemotaxis protein